MSCCAEGRNGQASGGGAATFSETELFTFNWTAQANFDFQAAGDGAYVVGGVTWNFLNMALANTAQIVNGTGLIVQMTSATSRSISDTSVTAPGMYGELQDLIPMNTVNIPGGGTLDVVPQPQLTHTFWWHIEPSLPVNDAHVTCCLRQDGVGTGYSSILYGGGAYRAAGQDQSFSVYANNRRTTPTFVDNFTAQANVYAQRRVNERQYELYAGFWDTNNDWPTWDDMLFYGYAQYTADTSNPVDLILVPVDTWVATWVGALGTAGATQYTLMHQRITRDDT